MSEIIINIDGVNPVDFFGVNNSKLDLMKKSFPKVKLTSRGNKIKIAGSEEDISDLKERIDLMVQFIQKYGKLPAPTVERFLNGDDPLDLEMPEFSDDILFYGPSGKAIKAKTRNQQRMVEMTEHDDIVFAIGPAGTGKTYTAVAVAVNALKNRLVSKIILTRPAVEAGEALGFLPGDIKDKVDPYLRPLYDALDDMLPVEKLNYYMQNRVIEIAPLAFMRGRTLDNAFIILDEAQNASELQVKMLLTRLGPTAKCIVTGDLTQIDLPPRKVSGLHKALDILKGVDGIGQIYLTNADVIRHKLVKEIITAYGKQSESESKNENKPDTKAKVKTASKETKPR